MKHCASCRQSLGTDLTCPSCGNAEDTQRFMRDAAPALGESQRAAAVGALAMVIALAVLWLAG